MSDEIKDAILPILMTIQADMAARFNAVEAGFNAVDARFDKVDDQMRKQRCDLAGILVMMKSTASAFDERVEALEKRVDALERRQH